MVFRDRANFSTGRLVNEEDAEGLPFARVGVEALARDKVGLGKLCGCKGRPTAYVAHLFSFWQEKQI